MISFSTGKRGKLRKKMFWTNQKFVFFFNYSNWEKFVDKIGESNWWKYRMNSIQIFLKRSVRLWYGILFSSKLSHWFFASFVPIYTYVAFLYDLSAFLQYRELLNLLFSHSVIYVIGSYIAVFYLNTLNSVIFN